MPGNENLQTLPDGMASQTNVALQVDSTTKVNIGGSTITIDGPTTIIVDYPRRVLVSRGEGGRFGQFEAGLLPGDRTREYQRYNEPNDGVVDILTAVGPDGHIYFAITHSLRPMVSEERIMELIRGYGKYGKTARESAIDEAREESADALEGQSISRGVLERAEEVGNTMSTNTAMTRAYVHYFRIEFNNDEIDWEIDQNGNYTGHIKNDLLETDPTLIDIPIPDNATDEERMSIEKENKSRQGAREKLSNIEFLPPERIKTPDGFTRAGIGTAEIVKSIKDAAITTTRRESQGQITVLRKLLDTEREEITRLNTEIAQLRTQLAVNAGAVSKPEKLIGLGAIVGLVSSLVLGFYSLRFMNDISNAYELLPTAISFLLAPAYALVNIASNPNGFIGKNVQRLRTFINSQFRRK